MLRDESVALSCIITERALTLQDHAWGVFWPKVPRKSSVSAHPLNATLTPLNALGTSMHGNVFAHDVSSDNSRYLKTVALPGMDTLRV